MERNVLSLGSEDLIVLYHEINQELISNLLNGASWDEQQYRIITLTEISKELTRRKIETARTDMPKDSALNPE